MKNSVIRLFTRYMGFSIAVAFWIALAGGCEGKSPTAPDGSKPANSFRKHEETLRFRSLQGLVREPGQIHFFFSLRDANDDAVLIDPAELARKTRIFEDDREIDYRETNFFIRRWKDVPLDIVLVLDFTNSMATFRDAQGTGIDRMLAGSLAIIRTLAPRHRLALLEFHDKNLEPQILSYFTSDTTVIIRRLMDFAAEPVDHGSTRIWDAVRQGIDLFANSADDAVRMLIFLTDGFDTSSRTTPKELMKLAEANRVQLHVIAAGQVANEDILRQLAETTDGGYYLADQLELIQSQMQTIARNLRGQFRLTYLTLNRRDEFVVRVEMQYQNALNWFSTRIDLSGLGNLDDRQGRIDYCDVVFADSAAIIILLFEHIPRNVSELTFRIESAAIDSLMLLRQANGGMLDSTWLFRRNSEWITLFSITERSLPFGGFGPFFRIRLAPISGTTLELPFAIDNSVYHGQKVFLFPETLDVGLALFNPRPADSATDVPRDVTLQWQYNHTRGEPVFFDVRLDTLASPQRTVATGLREPEFPIPWSLEPGQIYYWQVIAVSEHKTVYGPVWRLQVGG
ncbi:MAG: vWA domain-containing protein [candidate division KSB1 bacterium]|nr:vWA domain-containing protein [candidate division KSB1 bacterium]